MAIDDVLSDAKASINEYLTWKEYDEATLADVRWLLGRMDELRRLLEAVPGVDVELPRFAQRFGQSDD